MVKYFNKCRILKAILTGIFIISIPLMWVEEIALYTIIIAFVSAISVIILKLIIDDAEKELGAMSQNIRELEAEIRKLKGEK